MDSKDLSLNIATKVRNDGLTRAKVYSPEALEVLNAKPVNTAWGWDHGRPVYNRMPMIAEAYQKSYNFDQALVYLDPTVPIAIGPGTLEAVKSQRDWRILDVLDGTLTWEHGELGVPRYRINVTELDNGRGLQDGAYQVGYRLTHTSQTSEDSRYPGFSQAYVENGSLADIQLAYDSYSDIPEHREAYAISQLDNSWWPNGYGGANGYLVGTHYTIDFLSETTTTEFKVTGDHGFTSCSLAYYRSDNAIIWYKKEQVVAENDVWTIDAQGPDVRYHRFFTWDGKVSINDVSYTGEGYFRDKRVLFGESKAEPFIESMYDEIDGSYILLATFTVSNGVIDKVDDKRRVTYEKYQPVADWLTKFQDEQLRCRFDDVVKYNTLFMNPATADYQFYEEMDDSNCWGLGEVTLGNEGDVPVISYPTEVEVLDSNISPYMIDHVTQPVYDGDIATMPYSQFTLNDWSMDNGKY